jgi:phage shock protein A
MKQHIENTRRQLGELGAMAAQTEAMERKILERAEKLLVEVETKLKDAGASALTGGQDQYTDLVEERGRLQQVIVQAKAVLA